MTLKSKDLNGGLMVTSDPVGEKFSHGQSPKFVKIRSGSHYIQEASGAKISQCCEEILTTEIIKSATDEEADFGCEVDLSPSTERLSATDDDEPVVHDAWTITPRNQEIRIKVAGAAPGSNVENVQATTMPLWKLVVSMKKRDVSPIQSNTSGEPTTEKEVVAVETFDGKMMHMKFLIAPHGKMSEDDYEAYKKRIRAAKKATVHIWYRLLAGLICHCEFPVFPSQGRKFKHVYQLNDEIKSGAFGTVCRGTHRESGEQYAVKIVPRASLTPEQELDIINEVSILWSLRKHDNIVRLVDFFEQNQYFLIVMELCEGGDLFDKIGERGCYTERDARDLCRTLLDTIRFCHEEKQIAHCDLKPNNLLLMGKDDNTCQLKVADFGLASRVFEEGSLTRRCGTPFFVAPEILRNGAYDQRADMWSTGVIIYILLGGICPFKGINHQEVFKSILAGKFEFPEKHFSGVSKDAKELINSLLRTDPAERYTAKQALRSRWIQVADARTLERNNLMQTSQELRLFRARMKLKAAMIGCRFLAMKKTNNNLGKSQRSLSRRSLGVSRRSLRVISSPDLSSSDDSDNDSDCASFQSIENHDN